MGDLVFAQPPRAARQQVVSGRRVAAPVEAPSHRSIGAACPPPPPLPHAAIAATLGAAVAAHSRLSGRGRSLRRGGRAGRTVRRAWDVVVDLPVPSPGEVQAAAGGLAASAQGAVASAAGGAAAVLAAAASALPAELAAAAPQLPPEAQAGLRDALQALSAALPAPPPELAAAAAEARQALLRALPPEAAASLPRPEELAPVAQPAGLGALAVALLALRRGPLTFGDELPRRYDYGLIQAYWQKRPLQLLARFVEAGLRVGYYALCVQLDEWTGRLEEMRPERAVQARELITDLGVTFIKIAQVWASRPDILPKEYIKEYEKLLEQVRPFGREEAMETLRRNTQDGVAGIDLFGDLSVFEKPIASASVGQVYKAELDGRTVAVKVQRPDVREQSTLDLYVIRNAGALGAMLPFERIARQSKSLVDLIDLTAPTFITELDYVAEAANQRRFAETVAGCSLVQDTVVVPEVLYASREVLVQEWLDGKKLTEPGAAQEQAGKVVKLLLNSYMVQFLETGFLHGDPHPGNFILMDSGKLGILDYGLMTSITPEKRLAFIEFLMHLQAKDYGSCLEDLINLEFFPKALGQDKEAVDVIVPTLASTLSTLYEEGGDLKRKQEMFRKQREEMQASGKLDTLRTQLQEISKKYSGSFRLPPYFTLILRAFSTLEGLGLKTNADFAIVKECFPYIARRLITDDSFRVRSALRNYLYQGRERIAVTRIDDLASGFSTFTNLMKGSRRSAMSAGGPSVAPPAEAAAAPAAASASAPSSGAAAAAAAPGLDSATREVAEIVFSPDGNYLQELLIDEGVAAVDALSRAALVRLLQALGPLALPVSAPLALLLGSQAGGTRLLARGDKEALLVLRRIVRLLQARGADGQPEAELETTDVRRAAEDLQRLQPLAQGLLPAVAPGATAFARRFVQQLARRILLRTASDIEQRAGLGGGAALARAAT